MSSVGRTNGDLAADTSNSMRQHETRQSHQGQVARNRHQSPADPIYKQMRFSSESQFDFSLGADSDDFLKSYNAAKHNAENEKHGAETETQSTAADERVIAVAQHLGWTGLPTAATVQQPIVTQPEMASLIDTITQLVTKAISADAASHAGQAARFRFALPEGNLGISHVQIIMTSSTIDVVLERPGLASGDKFATAANTLADRLLTRFSKRSVRIIERLVDAPDANSPEAAEALERQENFRAYK